MHSLIYFLLLYVQTLGVLLLFAITGYFLIAPFCSQTNFVIFSAPIAGIMFTGLGCAVFYGCAGLNFIFALLVTFACGTVLSILELKVHSNVLSDKVKNVFFIFLIFIAALTYLCNYHSIDYGESVLLLMAGSDHLGYANVADWILHHPISQAPQFTLHDLSQNWPAGIFSQDRRFGTYYFYTAILWLKQQPAQYIYNFVIGIGFSAGLLGVVSTNAKKTVSIFLLGLAVLMSTVFEASLAGYLGKLIGYLAVLTVAGLFLNELQYSEKKFIHFFLIILGLCTLYPGQALTFVFVGTVFFAVLTKTVMQCVSKEKNAFELDELKFVLLMTILPLVFSGVFALPQGHMLSHMVQPFPYWERLLAANYSLISADLMQSVYPLKHVNFLACATVFFSMIIGVIAFKQKNYLSFAYLFFPLLWLGFALTHRSELTYFISYEFLGMGFILSIIALIHAIDYLPQARWMKILLISLIVIELMGCFGRFRKEMSYFNPRAPKRQILVPSQLEQLTQKISGQSVLIDTHDPLTTFLMLNYANQPDAPKIYWSQRAWYSMLYFLPNSGVSIGKAPVAEIRPQWLIEVMGDQPTQKNCQLKYHTNQYFLYRC